jgi:glycine reductase complex component B subunit alpha and beta
MRLELRYHDVNELTFGTPAGLRDGCLSVDRDALASKIISDPRIASVDIELVGPDEDCRILSVVDVVQPRYKQTPADADYPGALGPVQATGIGITHVLRNVALTVSASEGGRRFVNMRPPRVLGEPVPPFERYAGLHHVVVVPKPAEGVTGDDWRNALRLASLRAGVHLARSANGAEDASEVLELGPVDPGVPRVAYVYQLHSHQSPTVPGEPVLYGDNVRYLLPTILHPNEVIDGGLVASYGGSIATTYAMQNNDIVRRLYALHGKEINFLGVVVYVANQLPAERDRATLLASNLVKYTLRADGAVFTKSGGGAPNVDMALIADRCEQLGVKTSLMVWETTGEGETEDSPLFNLPSLDAIVSLGSSQMRLSFDPVARTIGSTDASAGAARTVAASQMLGAIDQLGGSRFTVVRH